MNIDNVGGSSSFLQDPMDDSSIASAAEPENVVENDKRVGATIIDTASEQLAQGANTRPSRWSEPVDRFSGPLRWQDSYTHPTPGTSDAEFRLLDSNGDGILDPNEKLEHYDNNMDGRLNGEDDLNGDGFVNPWEDHMS